MLKSVLARCCALVVIMCVLPACNATKGLSASGPVQTPEALRALSPFKISGGLSAWTDKESISTRIEWQQVGENFSLNVTAPAGLTSVQITRNNGQASVQRAGGQPVYGDSATTLLQRELGLEVRVPVEQLSLWVRGLQGDANNAKYDELGRLLSMQYRDSAGTLWRAKLSRFTRHQDNWVPGLISAAGGPYNVRLVLKQWSKLVLGDAKVTQKPTKSTGRLSIPGK